MPAIIPGMPRRKRRTKKQPEPTPEPIAKIKKRRRRRHEPVPVPAKPKPLMQQIFESQRQELDRLNAELQKKVTG
jgi:hypothetical protein